MPRTDDPTERNDTAMDDVLQAASRALGEPLTDPVRLTGSRRTTVLRCRASTGSVIVKTYGPDAHGSYTAEAAGLSLTTHGPQVLATDRGCPLIVMSDVGGGPSLADALLGDSATTASTGLLAWAAAYGELAVETAGRQHEWATARLAHDLGTEVYEFAPWRGDVRASLASVLRDRGIDVPGLDGALDDLSELDGSFPVFSPGDVCPDNNVLGASGARLLDFEGAGFHSAFLDAAYTTMPFSSCWCVFQLPRRLQRRVESTYRAAVTTVHPELGDDAVWRHGLQLATAAWTVDTTTWLLPTVTESDRPTHPSRHPVPSARQLLRHRWSALALQPDTTVLAGMARELLAATEGWETPPLPTYPPFRPHRVAQDGGGR